MPKKGILGIGAPMLDSFAFVGDSLLEKHNLTKNAVYWMELPELQKIKADVNFVSEAAGGSVMNAIRWIGLLGYRVGFQGQYGDDDWGKVVENGLWECNVENKCIVKKGGNTTNICILVTPDAARTMMAVKAASAEEFDAPVNWKQLISEYECIAFEGFQFADQFLMTRVDEIVPIAHELGVKIAVLISPMFFLDFYKDNLYKHLDKFNILTGNDEEWMAFLGKKDIDGVLEWIEKSHLEIASVTMGAKGAWIVRNGKRFFFNAPDVDKVVDTTGAGDGFAAGLLYGHFSNLPIEKVGKLAAYLPGIVIAKDGAVPIGPNTKKELEDFVDNI